MQPAKNAITLALVVLLPFFVGAGVSAKDDIKVHSSCLRCGMNREQFSHSRMFLEFDNGETIGTCSLRCMTMELNENAGRKTRALKVADYESRDLLDAEKATWVIGGNVAGVMAKRAKWAFGEEAAARRFQRRSGGEIATFLQALLAANEDLKAERVRP